MLNIYSTLEELILEVASRSQVETAIDKKQRVRIYYDGDTIETPGYRWIEPYGVGISKAGNPIVRAWQLRGVTDTEQPAWKTFRLDRIQSWTPIPSYFYFPISDTNRTPTAPRYNDRGDGSMTQVHKLAQF